MAPMSKVGVGQSLLQATVVREQQQAFAIGIQPACGVDLRNVNQVSQASPTAVVFQRELAQHAERFVQQQRCQFNLRFLALSRD